MRRGTNLGGALDRRDGRAGWELRSGHLDAIAAARFKAIRLPVRWWDRGADLLPVGEFGAVAAADHESRLRWTSWVRRELERLDLPWAYWDFATEFGAWDLERDAWHEDLLAALSRG